jgi:hypothetical protein
MQIQDLDQPTFRTLDDACGGTLQALLTLHESQGYEVHLSVQSHIEGLKDGEMKLYFQVISEGETKDFAIARLNGSAQIIGWNIYLHDRLSSAKVNLNRANLKIDLETCDRLSGATVH